MQTRTKIILLLSFILVIVAVSVISSNLVSTIEDDTYLTPMPYETISAYKEEYPIDSKQEALIMAYRYYIFASRLSFTQGDPKVISVEKTNLADANNLIDHTSNKPGDTEVWLVVFEGSWQIAPPDGDLTPLETGCIYVLIEANEPGYGGLSARSCISQK